MSSIKCLERALDILELMYQNGGKMTLTEISNSLSLYKSTVLRTLVTLAEKDFIMRDEYTGVYSLGSKVFILGLVAAHSLPIAKIARPHLTYLSEKYDVYADLSALDNGIERSGKEAEINSGNFIVVFQQYLNNTYSQTLITPSQCESSDVFLPAVYMCFLAYSKFDGNPAMLKEHYAKILNRCTNNKWSYEEFLNELNEVQKKGYSCTDLKSSHMCIAAPIFDSNDILIAVISIRGTKTKFNKVSFENVVDDIVWTARMITEQCKKL